MTIPVRIDFVSGIQTNVAYFRLFSKLFYSLVFAFLLFFGTAATGQIYEPEGLNMPGAWNGWTNPPANNLAFASATQVSGGRITKITTGTVRWQTSFFVAASGGDLVGGNYNWVFSSGSSGSPWSNKWVNVNTTLNTLQTYTWVTSGGTDNNITLTNGKYYTMNWQDNGYVNTQAIFMETTAAPVNITAAVQSPTLVTAADDVAVDITLSATPSAEEKFYLRYSNNNWSTSSIIAVNVSGSTGTVTIPAQNAGLTVSWYIFSTTISNPTANFDMLTLKLNNNGGVNYTYTVLAPVCGINVVSTAPVFPMDNSPVQITFDAAAGNTALLNYAGDVYIHAGVITNLSSSDADWKYTKTGWGVNTPETLLTKTGTNTYTLDIANIRSYFGVPGGETILKMVMVFRSDGVTPIAPNYLVHKESDGSDILVDVYSNTLNVKLINPKGNFNLVELNALNISVCAAAINHDDLSVYIGNNLIDQTTSGTLSQVIDLTGYTAGEYWIYAHATSSAKAIVKDSVAFYIRGPVNIAALPAGVIPGINYIDNQTVTLVLHDPPKAKEHVFVIGEFNDWSLKDAGYMNSTADGEYYWKTISGLTSGEEYAYQYYIDGELRLADPYTEKVLDPWNDHYISSTIFPGLKPYPSGKTTGIVSVLQPGRTPYQWEVTNFTLPDVRDLVIYELHIRDFVASDAIKDVTAKLDYLQSLGVNAIELMPINEFEGNDSWGYNPSFYFATDKAYGTREDYKRFIDECHKRGMAVIIDMVLNHSFSQSPLVQMYFDANAGAYGQVTANNPWYNVTSPNPSWSWGFDFDHESIHTKNFIDRVNAYWLTEFKVDGFRFDFTKGFTNTPGEGWDYDQARINILTRMADHIWATKPGAYVILEHLADNSEETVLANYGMLMWANMNHQYNQSTMGFSAESDLGWGVHTARGFAYHNLLSYMESHDEDRLMYRNLSFGNSANPAHDVKNLDIALARSGMAAAFYLLTPGPRMIWQFGELGYDFGINHCPDGTYNSDCRTSRKPIPWSTELNYFNVPSRRALYDLYADLNRLKINFNVFRTGNIGYQLNGYLKRLHLNENIDGSGQKITLIGNFDVVAQNITPFFQQTGTWYEYFTGEVRNVSSTTDPINLQPGEYRLYSETPFYNNYYSKSTGDLSDPASWGTNTNGTGGSPANFAAHNSNYYIHNRSNVSISADWTLSGNNTRLFVGDGITSVNLSVEAHLTADYMVINPLSEVHIQANGKLTVNEFLQNDAGVSKLVIESNSTGTGSLIHPNNGLEATVKRHMNGGGYHFVSLPVTEESNPTASLFMNSYLYRFDGPTQDWMGYGNNPAAALHTDQGYMIWYTGSNTTYSFAGQLNSGMQTAKTASAASTFVGENFIGGYNLVPNPYPSAINWNEAAGFSSSNLRNQLWVFNRTANNYGTYIRGDGSGTNSVTGIIPVGQAFFVQAGTTGNPSLTMNNAARVHSNSNILKKSNSTDARLRLTASANSFSDEMIVALNPDATYGFDMQLDGTKLRGNASSPQIYTLSEDGVELSINNIPQPQLNFTMPLAFELGLSTDATFHFSGMESIDAQLTLLLEDLLTDSIIDLRENSVYNFSHQTGNDAQRFQLHFMHPTAVSAAESLNVHIWNNGSTINIYAPDAAGSQAQLSLFDVQGRLIQKQNLSLNTLTSIYAGSLKGPGLLHIVTSKGTITHKFFIY
jgi:glycosidase